MRILKALCIAFSMYSAIPVPQFPWEEDDMKYVLCFFPWVGIVIGILTVCWGVFCEKFAVGTLCFSLVAAALPLMVSGGFHVDGFLDTMDAFCSRQPREKKLEILKDSHIGAFSVIMLVLYYLLLIAAYSELDRMPVLASLGVGFALSRTLSGIGMMHFPAAKKDGTLYFFAESAKKKTVRFWLYVQLVLYAGVILWFSKAAGVFILAAALCSFWYYGHRCRKELGGITGDTAGWFVTICEGAMTVAAAAVCIIFR